MNNIKNLVICSDNYPTKADPTHPFVEQLCYALAECGLCIAVISPQSLSSYIKAKGKRHPIYRKEVFKNGKEIIIFQPFIPSLGLKFKKYNSFIYNLIVHVVLMILPFKPDAFYGHFWRNAYRMYPFALRYKKPLFVATGESVINFGTKEKVPNFDSFVDYISGVICVSSKNKEESIQLGLTDEKKCKIIPNAINENVFKLKDKRALRRLYNYNEKDFIVAFVGWWINRKGPQRVAQAITKSGREIKSFFIGGPNVHENIEPECNGILFKGIVDHTKVADYLNMADVFVLPTLNEGCCNAVIEAMACGLPIVSSNKSFNWDVLNESNSILIDPENITEISSAISRLYDNRELCNNLALGALNKAKELTLAERAKSIISFMNSKVIKNTDNK